MARQQDIIYEKLSKQIAALRLDNTSTLNGLAGSIREEFASSYFAHEKKIAELKTAGAERDKKIEDLGSGQVALASGLATNSTDIETLQAQMRELQTVHALLKEREEKEKKRREARDKKKAADLALKDATPVSVSPEVTAQNQGSVDAAADRLTLQTAPNNVVSLPSRSSSHGPPDKLKGIESATVGPCAKTQADVDGTPHQTRDAPVDGSLSRRAGLFGSGPLATVPEDGVSPQGSSTSATISAKLMPSPDPANPPDERARDHQRRWDEVERPMGPAFDGPPYQDELAAPTDMHGTTAVEPSDREEGELSDSDMLAGVVQYPSSGVNTAKRKVPDSTEDSNGQDAPNKRSRSSRESTNAGDVQVTDGRGDRNAGTNAGAGKGRGSKPPSAGDGRHHNLRFGR